MKSRPILFKAEMVRAILLGRKTQTRRIVKFNESHRVELGGKQWHIEDPNAVLAAPLGQPGDYLWVKETWRTYVSLDHLKPCQITNDAAIEYAAGGNSLGAAVVFGVSEKWRSPLFMVKGMSRVKLRITSVRVERLNDISEKDAMAEGVNWQDHAGVASKTAKKLYADLWESIHSPGSWAKNPWVWVYSFKKI